MHPGASGNHGQFVSHAHIMLVGFVTSLVYAAIYRLWLPAPPRALATIQFVLHQAGSLVMFAGLLLMLVMVLRAEAVPVQSVGAVDGRSTATN